MLLVRNEERLTQESGNIVFPAGGDHNESLGEEVPELSCKWVTNPWKEGRPNRSAEYVTAFISAQDHLYYILHQ